MDKYAQARSNMVDCQIHPNGVIDPRILTAFETLPREQFVPPHLQGIAYNDEDFELPGGRLLLEPQTHARMLQVAAPKEDDVCLVIGDGCGYASAILGMLAMTVITLTNCEEEHKHISEVCAKLGICNVAAVHGKIREGNTKNAPYSLIFINGAVSEVPEAFKEQLAEGGRLVSVVKPAGRTMGDIVLTEFLGGGRFSSYNHYGAGTPYIPEFVPKRVFAL